MDDKRTALAVIFSILAILAYQKYLGDQRKYEMERYRIQQLADGKNQSSPIAATSAAANSAPNGAPGQAISAPPAQAAAPLIPSDEETRGAPHTIIESNKARIIVTHLGGRLISFQPKNMFVRVGSSEPLDLITHQSGEPLPLGVYLSSLSDTRVLYTLERAVGAEPVSLGANEYTTRANDSEFVFSGVLENGLTIRKTIIVQPDSFLIKVKVNLTPQPTTTLPIWLEWGTFVPEAVANERYNLHQFKLLTPQNKITNILPSSVTKGLTDYGANQWLSFGDTYFMSAIIAPSSSVGGGSGAVKIGKEGDTYLGRIASESDRGEYLVYVGPKYHQDLQRMGYQLERNVDLGIFSFLAHPLLGLLRFLHGILHNWGLAIIALTLLIKLALLPLAQAGFKSMKAMQDLQPEIKVLKERIKDQTELNQEMLALYKKRGVNPVGGCLPMLLQVPVFLGLYNALLNAIELRHAPFALWINDLATPERLEVFGIGVPVMILIMGVTMFIQQWTTPSTMDPAQKKAMMLMPFMFTGMFIIFPFPSGLVLYWLVNNLISIVQQVYLRGSSRASPFQATILASIGIFALGYIVTLL
jgi:YidC/Oxa1 family membrane protein insertase